MNHDRSRIARYTALVGYLGLITLVILWQGVISPHPHISPVWLTTLWLIPLLFPLRGMLRGTPYTYAWGTFISTLYLTHAAVLLYTSPEERLLAFIELCLVSSWIVGSTLYARWKGQELGLGLKKRKQSK